MSLGNRPFWPPSLMAAAKKSWWRRCTNTALTAIKMIAPLTTWAKHWGAQQTGSWWWLTFTPLHTYFSPGTIFRKQDFFSSLQWNIKKKVSNELSQASADGKKWRKRFDDCHRVLVGWPCPTFSSHLLLGYLLSPPTKSYIWWWWCTTFRFSQSNSWAE